MRSPAGPIAIAIAIAIVACKSEQPTTRPSTPASSRSLPEKTTAVTASTGADASLGAVPDAAGAARPDVDLLHWTNASVAVPHNVKNPRDYPEHLVDGKPETAWNGETGSLVGSDIAFRVPDDTRIKRIEMSAGFEKTGPKGDFFTMNHRIKKVAVFGPLDRSTVYDYERKKELVVGTFDFNTDDRHPNVIKVDRPGGLYVIRVLEVVPGTKKEWTELTVSELRVLGDPGKNLLPRARVPHVSIGGPSSIASSEMLVAPNLQKPDLSRELPIHASSAAEVCTRWDRVVAPIFAKHYTEGVYPGAPDPPHCKVASTYGTKIDSTRAKSLRTVALSVIDATNEYLLIETDKGFVVPRDALLREESRELGSTKETAKIVRARVEGSDLIVSIEFLSRYEFWCVGTDDGPTRWENNTVDFDLRCNLDATPMTCARLERKRTCKGECSMYQ